MSRKPSGRKGEGWRGKAMREVDEEEGEGVSEEEEVVGDGGDKREEDMVGEHEGVKGWDREVQRWSEDEESGCVGEEGEYAEQVAEDGDNMPRMEGERYPSYEERREGGEGRERDREEVERSEEEGDGAWKEEEQGKSEQVERSGLWEK
jgi:hypothetical protein